MLEEFTNLALAKAELEAEPQLHVVTGDARLTERYW